jgi:hypothetical protein
LYFTLNTASGLKYYDFLINAPAAPSWVADNSGLYYEGKNSIGTPTGKPWYTNIGIQVKAPQFTVVDVTVDCVTFTTYRIDTMEVMDKYTVNKTLAGQPNIYTVNFKDWNGTVLKTEIVEEGRNSTAPANPVRAGYTFTGWDKSFTNVMSDLIVTAMYSANNAGGDTGSGTSSITLDKTGTQNMFAIYGYLSQQPLTVTVTSTGTAATGVLNVSLSGTDALNFNLSSSSVNSITAGSSGTFAVTPKTGLSAGTYAATVTVAGAGIATKSFIVNFTVDKKAIAFTGAVSASKEYDGNGNFSSMQIIVNNAGNFSGLVAGDSVTLDKAGVTGTLASGSRSGNLTLNGTFGLSGPAADNYVLSAQPSVAATITAPANLSSDSVLLILAAIIVAAFAIFGVAFFFIHKP